MKIFPFAVLLLILAHSAFAQVRVGKLVIKPFEVYEISASDILVADTLIMMDSSTIKLNPLKRDNFIRVNMGYFGSGCAIVGNGVNGADGRPGRDGDTPFMPCKDGEDARNGGVGLDGGSGSNLYLYFEELVFSGKLKVDLSGGSGGEGGAGGNGGGGSPGTVHCQGGDAGNGGNGGKGGDGGNGGQLIISCIRCPDVRVMVSKNMLFHSSGGHFGFGGKGGYPGAPGLAPSRRNGEKGNNGADGENGKPGAKGTINFEIN